MKRRVFNAPASLLTALPIVRRLIVCEIFGNAACILLALREEYALQRGIARSQVRPFLDEFLIGTDRNPGYNTREKGACELSRMPLSSVSSYANYSWSTASSGLGGPNIAPSPFA